MKREELRSLTSLRFFAAALIVIHHCNGIFGIDENFSGSFPAYQAVSFFFVLSGFILTYVYKSFDTKESLNKFYASRFARIWPLHVATLFLTVLFFFDRYSYFATNPGTVDLFYKSLASNFFLVHGWIPVKDYYWSFNAVSWSISTEMAFYLVFPLLVVDLNGTWKKKLVLTFLLSISMILISSLLNTRIEKNPHLALVGLLNVNPVTRLFEFSVGMSAALFHERAKKDYRPGSIKGTCIEIFLLMIVVGSMSLNGFYQSIFSVFAGEAGACWVDSGVLNSIWFAMLILCFSVHRGWISKLLSAKIFVLLGEISFSIYLLHQIMTEIYRRQIAPVDSLPPFLSFAYFWAVLLTGSYLCWQAVEKPSRKAIVGIFVKRSPHHGQGWGSRGGAALKLASACAVMFILVSPVVIFVKKTPAIQTINEAEAETIAGKSMEKYRNIKFGDTFVLAGADFVRNDEEDCLRLVWRAARDTVLSRKVAVHFLNRDAGIVGKSDYFQSQKANVSTPVSRNTIWVDKIKVPADMAGKADKIGICIYKKQDLLQIDKGPRDWNGRRLLIDLTVPSQTDVESRKSGVQPR